MAAVKKVLSRTVWKGAGAFEHVPSSGQVYATDAVIPGESERTLQGPSPMEVLLGAACGCLGVDLVSMLAKMRLDLRELSMTAEGERLEDFPRVYRKVTIVCRIETEPPDVRRVRQAVELSANKYCAVMATLAAAGEVRYRVATGGEEFEGVAPGAALPGVPAAAAPEHAAPAPAQHDAAPDDPAPVEAEFQDALDLHAFAPQDSRVVVEEYLHEARVRGLREVRIIHGKGSGVQQRIVAGVLDRHPGVQSYRQAPADRGHYGATLVILRPLEAR